jgi:hypothetical protein
LSCGTDATGVTYDSKWATSTTDTLAIFTAGAQRVGIGTSTPKWSLQIASSTGPQLALADTSGTSNPWTFRSINGNLFVATASPSTFATSTYTALTVGSNGNIGIGTTTPQGRLTVSTNQLSQAWEQTGNTLSIAGIGASALAALSPNRVAFIDETNEVLRTYEFNGTSWAQVGTGLTVPAFASPALTALSPNRVAFIDATNDTLRTYEFNGTSWAQVGTGLTLSSLGGSALAALSPNRVAMIDTTGNILYVYEFNGTTWTQVGSGLSTSGFLPALAALSPNRVALMDFLSATLKTFEFNGSTWSQVGNGLGISGSPNGIVLASLSPNRVAYFDNANDSLRVYEFNGTTWTQVGSGLNITTTGFPSSTKMSRSVGSPRRSST